VKAPPFSYRAPGSLEEALALLEEHGDDAKVLAGGQSLVPLLALRLAHPEVLVDLNGLSELATIAPHNGGVAVGAMVRERATERSELISRQVPLLAEALPMIGHLAIRNRGTIGGSLSHADPAAELPAVAKALDAELVASSKARGSRTIPAAEFFEGYFTTALQPDEILTEVRFPALPPSSGTCFYEVSRRHGDFAMVGVGASLTVDDGRISRAAIALMGAAEVAVRARAAEDALVGEVPSTELFRDAGAEATRDLSPVSDLHASSEYRIRVGAVCVRRALEQAARRATGET
jgi:carbon-monoxide dehydrogenase medium subunit